MKKTNLLDVLFAFIKWANLTDRSGKLSITNVAVIVLITKIAIAPFDWPTAAALFVTLLNYSHKRLDHSKFSEKQLQLTKVEDLQESVETLKKQHEQVAKVAEEAKKFMSSSNLVKGFQAPNRKPNG